MKVLIFDSGPIINLSLNGLLYILSNLKKVFNGKFIITEAVKREIIDRPIKVPRFELSALKIQNLLDEKVIGLSDSIGIDSKLIKKESARMMGEANVCVRAKNRVVNIISEAETSCLALSAELSKKGVENIIAIDERTTRLLGEKPESLEKIMSDRMHVNVSVSCNLNSFKNFKFIRSTEIVYVAYKKGLLGVKGSNALEGALYATKFKGSAVSFEEIDILKKM